MSQGFDPTLLTMLITMLKPKRVARTPDRGSGGPPVDHRGRDGGRSVAARRAGW